MKSIKLTEKERMMITTIISNHLEFTENQIKTVLNVRDHSHAIYTDKQCTDKLKSLLNLQKFYQRIFDKMTGD